MEECNVNETFDENMLNQSRIIILRSCQPKHESKLLDLRKKKWFIIEDFDISFLCNDMCCNNIY